ncbi:unnamed protein product [Triticum turgidum subsp. durum]|uniref:GDSL esterase/lipase n=1 Tax=Triticum turgidum subsp. durum TaxID=4567 RepID=A0A9R0XYI8_TRITD|nr:unnamed protein product [Triticum turgidum subsp. durum]
MASGHFQVEAALLMLPLVMLALNSGGAAGAVVPAVIVFGDSTVDTGNNNQIGTTLRSDFPPYGRDMPGGARATGRFGNGRLPPDFISEALGLPPLVPAYLDPAYGIGDFARGVCFASAGTGVDNATAGVLVSTACPARRREVGEKGRRNQSRVGSRGPPRLGTGRFAEYTVAEFSDFLVAGARRFLSEIHRLGARRVTFAGLTPIGCLPLERAENMIHGGGCIEEYNRVAREYNAKVEAMLGGLRAELPDLRLAYVPVYDTMLDLVTNPAKFGLENVEEGCCATGRFEMGFMCNDEAPMTCADADKFLFWDAFHPTQKVNRIMANHTIDICYQQGLL